MFRPNVSDCDSGRCSQGTKAKTLAFLSAEMELQEQPPSTSTLNGEAPPSKLPLPVEINTATRALHTHLNRLITARLPLALPPQTSTPDVYARGLRAFASVYFAFEARWTALIAAQVSREEQWIAVSTYTEELRRKAVAVAVRGGEEGEAEVVADADMDEGEGEEESTGIRNRERVMQTIADLLPPGMMRTQRLERDLTELGVAAEIENEVEGVKLRVEEIVEHIRAQVDAKPWVLVAYAWVMYMAIFSGGRWIRQQLMDAGPAFWGYREEDGDEWKGLAFLRFDGEEDGEDIKAEFKRRLVEVEDVLDKEQRCDIVEEAKTIFGHCISLVGELDEMLGGTEATVSSPASGQTLSAKQIRKAVETEHAKQKLRQQNTNQGGPFSRPYLTGLAVVVGCISWYAYYFAPV